jgi:hypothetical protein
MTLGEVCCQAICSFEKGQHPFDTSKVKFNRSEESDHIICIKQNTETKVVPSQLLQKPLRVSLANQGMDALNQKHEEHGRKRVPLPKTATMANLFPWGAIEKDPSTRSGKNGGDPIGPIAWTTNRHQKVKKENPPNGSKALERSILNMIRGSFRLESNLVIPRTYLQLSWMRHLMKTLWLAEMRLGRCGVKRLAVTLDNSFPKLWRLMGR